MAKSDPTREPLTAERLRELLHYDPDTGIFTRRKSCKGRKAGSIAGNINHANRGYVEIGIDREVYYAQRLAWLYMTGDWPPSYVDHQHFQRSDNRWDTLRTAAPSESQFNRRKQCNNTSGYKGVHPHKSRWVAQIRARGKQIYLGIYDTPEEAAKAYKTAAIKYHGEYAHYDEPLS